MSRHYKVQQFTKEGLEEVYGDKQDDNEDEFDNESEELIQELYEDLEMKASRNQIIKALQKNQWDADAAFDQLCISIANRDSKKKEKESNLKLVSSKSSQQSKEPDAEQQKQQKAAQETVPKGLNLRKSSSTEQPTIRKQSMNESLPELSLKMDSFKYEKNLELFNKSYPKVNYDESIEVSKKGEQVNINLVVVGHVDSGKSTLTGHMSHLMNIVDQKMMHKLEKEAKEEGKESFKFAWAQDEFKEERERGVTMDIGFKVFRTKSKIITLLDSPGHKDFVPNMISGASQADYAILVVDSIENAFISGFEKGGQTKEHAYLLKALGISQLIVAINKMDLNGWSQEKYDQMVQKLSDFFTNIGFDKSIVHYIPLSAFQGINIIEKSNLEKLKWYTGPCLMDLIEQLQPPKREVDKPLRFNIYNCVQAKNVKGILLQGKIEGGVIQQKKKYVIMPHGIVCQVKDIWTEGVKQKYQVAGYNIDTNIIIKNENDLQNIQSGNVLCPFEYPIPATDQLVIQFATFDLQCPIIKGSQVVVYINTSKTPGTIKKILRLIDPNTGNTLKSNPKCVNKNQCAEILLQLDKNICAEIFTNYSVYGRVILREKFETLGVGIIKEIK